MFTAVNQISSLRSLRLLFTVVDQILSISSLRQLFTAVEYIVYLVTRTLCDNYSELQQSAGYYYLAEELKL